jgi:hypothetical protein
MIDWRALGKAIVATGWGFAGITFVAVVLLTSWESFGAIGVIAVVVLIEVFCCYQIFRE